MAAQESTVEYEDDWDVTESEALKHLVHTLDIGEQDVNNAYNPYDAGDADDDGLADLTVFGRTLNDFYIRVYESTSIGNYPTEIVWELPDGWWAVGAKIDDTDDDGVKEIVVTGRTFDEQHRVVVYENDGDSIQ